MAGVEGDDCGVDEGVGLFDCNCNCEDNCNCKVNCSCALAPGGRHFVLCWTRCACFCADLREVARSGIRAMNWPARVSMLLLMLSDVEWRKGFDERNPGLRL